MNERAPLTVRANLLPEYSGEDGDGDAFPLIEARLNAIESAESLNGRLVVFVGRRVAEAFGVSNSKWFAWDRAFVLSDGVMVDFRYAIIPHPSGRNRWWNDEGNVEEAGKFLKSVLRYESKVPKLQALRERCRSKGEQ
jgi:hypothetical protein